MPGAYKTDVRYVSHVSGVKYIYADTLPVAVRRFVIHPIDAIQAATGLPVKTHLHEKILTKISPGDLIPGAEWDLAYDPPLQIPDPIMSWDAPSADCAVFLSAVIALKNAVNRDIARHFISHVRSGEMDDNVVRAVEWLVMLAERAEDLANGA